MARYGLASILSRRTTGFSAVGRKARSSFSHTFLSVIFRSSSDNTSAFLEGLLFCAECARFLCFPDGTPSLFLYDDDERMLRFAVRVRAPLPFFTVGLGAGAGGVCSRLVSTVALWCCVSPAGVRARFAGVGASRLSEARSCSSVCSRPRSVSQSRSNRDGFRLACISCSCSSGFDFLNVGVGLDCVPC